MGPHFFKCGKWRSTNSSLIMIVKLQWGRTFSSAESRRPSNITSRLTRLQWGRTFSSAESENNPSVYEEELLASMGPHFFKCGKRLWQHVGRSHSTCFNGAALFQVRKELASARPDPSVLGFNGAALFQVRKVLRIAKIFA